LLGRHGQVLERLRLLACQAGTLPVQPALELRRVVHVEAVQQRSGVLPHRIRVPPRGQGLRERLNIRDDDLGVEAQQAGSG